ncbi:hypothetical protein STIAU_5634 [Stigmatella aurantiaca DW4/3-1]|uniref:Uncharacterized protein n=1 Tax=Stigmatella aurantiaca (strain DW4/3-1) TaxID=378806 RepID=Q09DP1_STIAD|nr:hypothetical protein STIAU_5634 [Stigmatella aurantiaca DW4/3-1]
MSLQDSAISPAASHFPESHRRAENHRDDELRGHGP